jgi:hypothetical protein
VRFRVSDGDGSWFLWVPRRVLILHLNRDGDGDWVPATYAQRPGSRADRLEGYITLRDLGVARPYAPAGPPPFT